MEHAIEIENLTKVYHGNEVLRRISLTIFKGELFAYLGPNGAGKTTTIRILTGMTRLGDGHCRINGYDVITSEQDAKAQYGLVSQAVNLDQELTVAQNLAIHGRLYRMGSARIKEKSGELLAYVDLEKTAE